MERESALLVGTVPRSYPLRDSLSFSGVVTKADRVSVSAIGRQKAWKDLFEGRTTSHKLRLGYYAVSLPDDKQRADNISRREAQQRADQVFDTVAPWKDLKATCPGRLGVRALVHDISPLLLKMLVDAYGPHSLVIIPQLITECTKPAQDPTAEGYCRSSTGFLSSGD